MDMHLLPSSAVVVIRKLAADLTEDDLAAPTPCAGWDVRALTEHLLHWGPSLAGAARKETVPPGAVAGLTLAGQLDRLAEAWSAPAAWEGETHMAGPDPLPADVVGGMVLGEFVVHGWDLARALGRSAEWDDDLLQVVYRESARMADQGRAMGVYGPEVRVPDSAPLLDRLLALTGRDPA
ncbi:TIGR03086 family metal-binding protein [Dactylosporangium sp. AC04546]|uniref:TIGR03086 family metal-binding protein n=1 Tax=Dactylosporangium sp. AC04546 TaxID=2862460 RepID=UPI001EE0A3F3|nr:TIGR03086 family metal-binding protein [Dactylosporangium sp. AC04546]WVK86044.1 TIGR03086 family metal-binding protein [Dactylosporangium sp. AC04546]